MWHRQQWLDDGYRDGTYYAREEGIPYLLPTNEPRHSHAVQAIKSEIGPRRIAESMGHVSKDGEINVETTMIYLRIAGKEYVKESREFKPTG